MNKTITIFRIDPMLKTVTRKEIPNTLEALQAEVQGSIEIAERFENGDVLYVNEAGLLNEAWVKNSIAFRIGKGQPLFGPAIVTGTGTSGDGETDDTDARLTLEEITRLVQFAEIPGRNHSYKK